MTEQLWKHSAKASAPTASGDPAPITATGDKSVAPRTASSRKLVNLHLSNSDEIHDKLAPIHLNQSFGNFLNPF
ncbi:hypothetical protein ACFX13_029584 [Malus domestica]